jgi:hypothetical protein
MLKSIVLAYQKCFRPLKISGIFGMEYGVCFRHLSSPQKSVMTRMVLLFFRMMKAGAAHLDEATLVNSPIDSRRVISSFVIC